MTNVLRISVALAISALLASTGCVPNTSLQPLAAQNQENIANYTKNNEVLYAALKHEAQLHVDLQVQAARGSVVRALNKINIALPSNPTDAEYVGTTKAYYTPVASYVQSVTTKLTGVDRESAAFDHIAELYPVIIDTAAGTRGFAIPRVLRDAHDSEAIRTRMDAETDPVIRDAINNQLNRILDDYAIVAHQRELGDAYLAGLDEYIGAVREQARIALSHAGNFVAFSQATPAPATLIGAAQDQDLRKGVLEIVARKKGGAFAGRVKDMLTKADKVVDIAKKLSGK